MAGNGRPGNYRCQGFNLFAGFGFRAEINSAEIRDMGGMKSEE
jgi:hypothetical protein